MKWLWLFSSIGCEIVGTTCLKLASQGGKYAGWYWAGVSLFYLACFALLGGAMRHFALSTVYATWSGLGVALVAVIGVVAFADPINLLKIVSLAMIIAGIIGLNLSGISH